MDRLKRTPIDTRECYKLKYNIQIIYTHNNIVITTSHKPHTKYQPRRFQLDEHIKKTFALARTSCSQRKPENIYIYTLKNQS